MNFSFMKQTAQAIQKFLYTGDPDMLPALYEYMINQIVSGKKVRVIGLSKRVIQQHIDRIKFEIASIYRGIY